MTQESGQNDDFLRLFMANQRKIYSFILMLVPNRNDADDIMQETLSVMWRKFSDYRPDSSFSSWGIRIAQYIVMAFRDKHIRSRLIFSEDVADKIVDKSELLSNELDCQIEMLQDCLKRLPAKQSDVINMRYEEGLTCKNISEKLGLTVFGVYKALSRIHNALLNCVQKRMGSGEIG
ncbi:MAG: sigma-70 family RNA polymerase sigma factor [Phycisphaerae bacterium]|nr:sigma-70 family RNA polymerase sigma factor [Phycisphaerae bacterium]